MTCHSPWGLDCAVQMAGAVDNSVNLDDSPTNFVESEIIVNHKDTIAGFFQLGMSGNNPETRMGGELADPFVQLFHKGLCSSRVIVGDPIVNTEQVLFGGGEIPNDMPRRHLGAVVTFSSFGRE